MKILACDPGPVQSAFVLWDGTTVKFPTIMKNEKFLWKLETNSHKCPFVIEKVECYGMPVGVSVFDTVFWSGRFCQAVLKTGWPFFRMGRKEVKMHLCGNMRAKDSNIIQALVDRFAPYEFNKGKGTKKNPGFFYGFKADIWQSMGLATTWHDIHNKP